MAGYKWKRTAAMLLTGAMLMSPGQYVFAAEGQPEEIAADASAESLDALDGNGSVVAVSDVVLAMIDAGTVYFDETTGYLLSTADGSRIDPATGEVITQEKEEPVEDTDGPKNPEESEDNEESDIAGDLENNQEPEDSEESETLDNSEDSKDPDDTGHLEGSGLSCGNICRRRKND